MVRTTLTWLGRKTRVSLPLLALLCACSSGPGGPDPGAIADVPGQLDPGTEVTVSAPAGVEPLLQTLDEARRTTARELRASHAVEFEPNLGYDPLAAASLDKILARFSSAPQATKERLSQAGFTIAAGHRFPSLALGYSEIYMADLPVFISGDMALEAIYRSHDEILQRLEKEALRPRLARLLTAIRSSLIESADALEPEVASDLNFYLGVAVSLLNGGKVDPREPSGVQSFVDAATQAAGIQERVLFRA